MSDRKPTARGGHHRPRMTGGSVQMEDRNVLRRMERERRSLEVQQEESQYDRVTPLFSEPFKRTKGDELSSLIQRMLGDYEDGCDAGPEELYSAHPHVPFPPVDGSKGSQCDSSRGADTSICIRHEGESWDSLPVLRAPAEPLSPLQSSDSAGDASPDRSRSPHRLDVPPLTLPLNVHGKLANAKKPTAYVRPMDGQDQVSSESPQLKASPEPRERLQDLKESSKATPLQCVDVGPYERVLDILQEMTSWPPLLTSIHTPNTAKPLKSLSTAEESPGFTAAPRLSSDRVQLEPRGASSFSSDSDSSSDPDNKKNSSPAQPASAETTHTQKESDWQLGRWLEKRKNQHQQNPGSPCDVIRPNSQDSSGGAEAAGRPGCFSSLTETSKDANGRQSVGSTFVCEKLLIKKSRVKAQHTENMSTHRPTHKRNKMSCHKKQKSVPTGASIRKQTSSKQTRQPLLVKIELNLLSRVPREPKQERRRTSESSGQKRAAETNEKSLKKKPKLDKEDKWSASVQQSQSEAGRCSVTMIKKSTRPRTSLSHWHRPAPDTPQMEAENHGKKRCKSNNVLEKDKSGPPLPLASRPRSVEDHMKEAKKLKHKADATLEKTAKALLYLEAVLAFVESGVAMEKEPQTPKSSYTMFSETLELIRFILKLKNYADPAAAARERDFLILCLRCQSLLQMAMFRYRREAALRYSRTLTDHFKSSSWSASPCVSRNDASPASSSGSLVVPQPIQQMAAAYVSITALVLSAHDTWEQAEELAHTGSGLLRELDSAVGALNLTSSISALVCYTRHGLQLLRLDSH